MPPKPEVQSQIVPGQETAAGSHMIELSQFPRGDLDPGADCASIAGFSRKRYLNPVIAAAFVM
jgi:hypothetical protein